MVSPLWNASSEGDADQVQLLLSEASPIDIEIKGRLHELFMNDSHLIIFCVCFSTSLSTLFVTDGSGATPLVQAVKNGHAEVVRALLDAGTIA